MSRVVGWPWRSGGTTCGGLSIIGKTTDLRTHSSGLWTQAMAAVSGHTRHITFTPALPTATSMPYPRWAIRGPSMSWSAVWCLSCQRCPRRGFQSWERGSHTTRFGCSRDRSRNSRSASQGEHVVSRPSARRHVEGTHGLHAVPVFRCHRRRLRAPHVWPSTADGRGGERNWHTLPACCTRTRRGLRDCDPRAGRAAGVA
mmetsp:Transcript_18195/g.53018  ORF Transcript_18195/g.53018 Transcript_18195/m.53018 type:complete len:200 (-) Transcript_18195:329-928(-)